jgi:hypothetical protein
MIMRILIDEQPSDIQASSIGEALNSAAADAGQRGRVIVEVHVDGETWSEEQLSSTERCAETAEELRLISADLRELVQQTLGEASEILPGADELQRAAAKLLQADQHTEAMDKLGEALAIWRTVQTAVFKSAQALGIDLEAVVVDGVSIAQGVQQLNAKLADLRGALEANDPVGVSDTLLYEMPDVVSAWRAGLLALQMYVQQQAEQQ